MVAQADPFRDDHTTGVSCRLHRPVNDYDPEIVVVRPVIPLGACFGHLVDNATGLNMVVHRAGQILHVAEIVVFPTVGGHAVNGVNSLRRDDTDAEDAQDLHR